MKIVLVTGGFDPLHSGHLEYFEAARSLGDYLIVGLNSDEWLVRKKGRPFMPMEERSAIINALELVDEVIEFDDSDNTACDAIIQTVKFWKSSDTIIFANGGDRSKGNVPEEAKFSKLENVQFQYGIGGTHKANSSSWILDEWKTQKTKRDWGYWRVLDHKPEKGYKVKELVIMPGQSLSDQRHFKRSEDWRILEGIVKMETEYEDVKDTVHLTPKSFTYNIGKEVWHKASNPGTEPAHILEVQWGTECVEEDIERRS